MITRIGQYALMACMVFIAACSSGGDSGGEPPTPPPGNGGGGGNENPEPKAATLVFPEDDSECVEGEVIDFQNSEVTFEWNPAEDADYYQLQYTNLESGNSFLRTTDTNSVTVTLIRGVAYSWSVISRANGIQTSAESEEWMFYNQGPGIENYAPFPAQAVNPSRGATLSGINSVDLEWEASDVDGDITSYEIFMDTATNPTTQVGETDENTLNVSVIAGTTYYWQVRAIDAFGNSSFSETFEFRVE